MGLAPDKRVSSKSVQNAMETTKLIVASLQREQKSQACIMLLLLI